MSLTKQQNRFRREQEKLLNLVNEKKTKCWNKTAKLSTKLVSVLQEPKNLNFQIYLLLFIYIEV